MAEHELFGRARGLPEVGALFAVGGPALCGLPPFGSGLGKAVAEEAAGHTAAWLPALYVLVSAVTGGAVLRAGPRIFAGVGRRPRDGITRAVRRPPARRSPRPAAASRGSRCRCCRCPPCCLPGRRPSG
ncbi:hypothetical protein ACFRNT_23430 [Streptomyces sp. NPDC056697]|uniref:hypothetical protein n=1 Tax=Streptomyces sp. NPDC056697 TaxID=3345915 RepID=UPI0036883FF3